MIHILGHLLFALGLLKWLSWELNRPFKPLLHWKLLVLTLCFSVAGLLLSQTSTSGLGIGNFLLHAVGGGMASASTFEYLRRSLKIKLTLRIELVALFFFVSGFGVLNELFEYALDAGGYGQFSVDRFDTWKDFVANTSGAYASWLLIYATTRFGRSK